MKFKKSDALTFGMELELQIINASTGTLSPSSLEFWNYLQSTPQAERFSLEATLATIELNTSVHTDADGMAAEAFGLTQTIINAVASKNLLIRGGGTHLTQFWNERVMAPTVRAQELSQRFGYLPKRFSTYGMHVHVGAPNPDAAIAMGNGLQALVPLFIAMSAASPFLQMVDTGFCASRPLEPLIYPHGGPMPKLKDWKAFEHVAEDMFSTAMASSLKDVYWDVRPKPEFGTIEVRVFDTPLSVAKAVGLAAFTRACAALILEGTLRLPDAPPPPTAERVSRFIACRDGLDAELFDPFQQKWTSARDWCGSLILRMEYAPLAESDLRYIRQLRTHIGSEQDSTLMRNTWQKYINHDQQVQSLELGLANYSAELSGQLLTPMKG